MNEVQVQMLTENNRLRTNAGQPVHVADDRLMRAAQAHATHMRQTGRLSHAALAQRVESEGFRWQAIAENVAEGQRQAVDVFASWMRSPLHKANLLGPTRSAGFGRDGDWWCAIYGTEATSAPPPPLTWWQRLLGWLVSR